jgi:glycosyltransferase involved in cell wall biosynthesis
MRVLAINKFYFVGGGAESVFFRTNDLLESAGHEVVPFATVDPRNMPSPWASYFAPERDYEHGTPVSRARDAAASIYSRSARRSVRKLIKASAPDVAHLHNVYHQLSLSIIDELRPAGLRAVLTLHDYKPVCPAYRLLADDGLCQRCVHGSFLNAVVHRCVKGSRAGSAVAAVEAYVSRFRAQYGKLDALISPSQFLADLIVRGGVNHRALHVLPNFVAADARPRALPSGEPRFLYAGRLSPEKGLNVLLDAARRLRGARITIAGGGPMEFELRRRVEDEALPVDFVGHLSPQALAAELRSAYAAVLPSVWYENCPMAVLEAAAAGVPTVGTALGGTPELIEHEETGLLVPPNDARALADGMESLIRDPSAVERAGRSAWEQVQRLNNPTNYLDSLVAIYDRAGSHSTQRSAA